MRQFADLALEGREALLSGDSSRLKTLMDRNFDIRSQLVRLDPVNVEMVHLARSLGVCAKYAGSGGSIVGICEGDDRFKRLKESFEKLGCEVVRPQVSPE
jgi:glucuronokinase